MVKLPLTPYLELKYTQARDMLEVQRQKHPTAKVHQTTITLVGAALVDHAVLTERTLGLATAKEARPVIARAVVCTAVAAVDRERATAVDQVHAAAFA